jgi:hypothetical protein
VNEISSTLDSRIVFDNDEIILYTVYNLDSVLQSDVISSTERGEEQMHEEEIIVIEDEEG